MRVPRGVQLPALCVLSAGLLCAGCEKEPGAGRGTSGGDARGARIEPAFLPSRDGFAFANDFPGNPWPTFAGMRDSEKSSFGLCGGMSAAAADYFFAQRPSPRSNSLPKRGSKLYEYIFMRQAESFGPGLQTALKFAEWMRLPDQELAGRTKAELDALEAKLKQQPIAPIGLIIARPNGPAGARDISDNHQVLAIGMARTAGGADIRIYDPNYPLDDGVVISIDFAKAPCGERNRPIRKPTAIRGFFVLPYASLYPPDAD